MEGFWTRSRSSSSEDLSDFFDSSSDLFGENFEDYFEKEVGAQKDVPIDDTIAQNNLSLISQDRQQRIATISQQIKTGKQEMVFHKLPQELYLVST